MDIQKMVDGQMAKIRTERLAGSEQLLLGEIKLKLDGIKDKGKPIVFDFKQKPAGACSWRGSYQELSLEYSDEGGGSANWNSEEMDDKGYPKDKSFKIPKSPSVKNFLDMINKIIGKDMVGWKGGDYQMHKNVAVYLGNAGESSVSGYGGKDDYPTVAVFDIIEGDDMAIIMTKEVDY